MNRESCIVHPRIIISSIEHESVLETARGLEKEGIEVVYLPVDRAGVVDLKKLKESLTENTVLVSVMYANNEIGTIQSIKEISRIIAEFRQLRIANYGLSKNSQFAIRNPRIDNYPLFHTDAAQAFQFLDCNVQNLGVDLMTLSAHKIYGPKGAGCLYARSAGNVVGVVSARNAVTTARTSTTTKTLLPLLTGGGQEFGLRSGTENVPAIVGFAKAASLRSHLLIQTNEQMRILRDYLWKGIKKIYPKAEANGERSKEGGGRNFLPPKKLPNYPITQLPNILNVYFPDHDAQDLLTRFDLHGLAVSSGSACRSRAMESSYVIQALGYSKERAKSSVRFSLGRPTTKKEIDEALKIIKEVLRR
jgi:cysteine desulfurase